MSYVVEAMQIEDIDEVIEIEREAFNTNWSASAYRRELLENQMSRYIVLRDLPDDENGTLTQLAEPEIEPARSGFQRLADSVRRLVGGTPELILPKRGHIVGYAGIWLMVDEAHLTAIAVRKNYQGRGFGELLLIKALDIARKLGSRVMTLEVRVSNSVAQSLYRKFGFENSGLRKRYYSDNNEDAYIMTTGELSAPEYDSKFAVLKTVNEVKTGIHDL